MFSFSIWIFYFTTKLSYMYTFINGKESMYIIVYVCMYIIVSIGWFRITAQ